MASWWGSPGPCVKPSLAYLKKTTRGDMNSFFMLFFDNFSSLLGILAGMISCPAIATSFSNPEANFTDAEGNPIENPNWNTVCPVAGMEFLAARQGPKFGIYRKWNAKQRGYSKQNRGDIPVCGLEWLYSQGVPGPFDRNSGRKALSRWVEKLNIPYPEQLHIHGDLEVVWRNHYQGQLIKSGNKNRKQSTNADEATRALKRFAGWLHSSDEPKPSIRQQLATILATLD